MIFAILVIFVAIGISAVSAYYSIAGMTAIFVGAFWPIVIMGVTLEAGKVVTCLLVHKYWHRMSFTFKAYFVPAILVLMLITSTGIYGYLSMAHSSEEVDSGNVGAAVALFDEKISTENDVIGLNRKALAQMDAQVDSLLSRTDDARGAEKAAALRKTQVGERKRIQGEIADSTKLIAQWRNDRAPLAAKARLSESHLGPIKYIADVIYGDHADQRTLEGAVRWVIIMLVFVFDPLALSLVIAADQTFVWLAEDKRKKIDEELTAQIEEHNRRVISSPPEPIMSEEDLYDAAVAHIEKNQDFLQARAEAMLAKARQEEIAVAVAKDYEPGGLVDQIAADNEARRALDEARALEEFVEFLNAPMPEEVAEGVIDEMAEIGDKEYDPTADNAAADEFLENTFGHTGLPSDEELEDWGGMLSVDEIEAIIAEEEERDRPWVERNRPYLKELAKSCIDAADSDMFDSMSSEIEIEDEPVTAPDYVYDFAEFQEPVQVKDESFVPEILEYYEPDPEPPIPDDLRTALDIIQEREVVIQQLRDQLNTMTHMTITDHAGNPVTVNFAERAESTVINIPDFSIQEEIAPIVNTVANFGLSFPTDPNIGDLFLRVDQLPSRLYKWNGGKWIDADKSSMDIMAGNDEYVKHLVQKLSTGEYELDYLTPVEQDAVSKYLEENNGSN